MSTELGIVQTPAKYGQRPFSFPTFLTRRVEHDVWNLSAGAAVVIIIIIIPIRCDIRKIHIAHHNGYLAVFSKQKWDWNQTIAGQCGVPTRSELRSGSIQPSTWHLFLIFPAQKTSSAVCWEASQSHKGG